jgi:NAD(P)-dependent dehydrogenase (short-subunit alcohol dehydrogenase family)
MASNTLTALITGGTSGIGRATANKLAQLGIRVLVVGRNPERGKKAVDDIREAGARRISFPPIFETQPAHEKWRKQRSNSEMVTSIF